MLRALMLALVGVFLMASARLAVAQQGTTNPGSPKIDPKLAAAAKISLDSARVIALRAVPRGTVASEELEREHGRLIYSFDMKMPGRQGVQEVNVNAITGAVVGVHHESPASELREKRADSKAERKDSSKNAPP
jgi:hypothetical protein